MGTSIGPKCQRAFWYEQQNLKEDYFSFVKDKSEESLRH
jgi:hypothetical protein